ncbi:MAG: LEA type 2 family protein [Halobacteriaceae archaeon]
MDIKSFFAGSRIRIVITVIILLGIFILGGYLLGIFGTPHPTAIQNRFGDVNQSTTEIVTNITIINPNPLGVTIGGLHVNYTVYLNGITMASGQHSGISIPSGRSSIVLHTFLNNNRIPDWWVSHIQNNETTVMRVDVSLRYGLFGARILQTPVKRTISTNILGQFNSSKTREINVDSALVNNPVAYINRTSGQWGNVTAEATPIKVTFVVYNPKPYPLTIATLGYNISMNSIDMGEGQTSQSYVIPPKSRKTIHATLTIDNSHLDEWWVSHIQRNQTTLLTLDFYAKIAVGDIVTTRVPLTAFTYTKTIETDFFGTKSSNTTNDSRETTTPRPTQTQTTTDQSITPTTTSTQTVTITETSTATTTQTTTEIIDIGNETTTTDEVLHIERGHPILRSRENT